MRTYTNDELKEILASHAEWLNCSGGQQADLSNMNLSYADLSYSDLRYVNLSFTNLSYTDLRSADLTNANLTGAVLTGADLTGADLTGANLTGADLSYADLSYAILRDVIGNGVEVESLRAEPWHIVYTKDIVAIGCQQHSKSDWLGFTDDQISEMSPRALEWWKEQKPKLIEMGIF